MINKVNDELKINTNFHLNLKLIIMKKTIILSGILVAFTFAAFSGKILHVDTYNVDTKKSSLEWYAEKLTGKHTGTILLSGGDIKNDHGNFKGSFEIDMNSILNKDMESEEYRTKLEKHLKSPDFFDVVKYPKANFLITSVIAIKEAKAGEATHTIKGNLTIKDKTNEISFDAVITLQPDKISCVGTAIVDRSKFDVRYGSKTFFEDIGDKIIYDEFQLKFNVVAVKQQ